MRKISLLLLLVLLLGVLPARAETEGFELVVGSTTQMSGYFFTDMWGNNTADMDVRALIHGYSTVAFSGIGNYQIDGTVVKDCQVLDDDAGNRTYTFTLQDGLMYNDGSAITARDYAFSALLLSAPEMTSLGSSPAAMQQLLGYEDFRKGKPFAGVRLLSDDRFSLTIGANCLPYFYELALVSVQPYPMQVIAPGIDVVDEGEGCRFSKKLDKKLLQKTVLTEGAGYLFMPAVSCGPYRLSAYDPANHEARFERNRYYKGNFEGQTPAIERVLFKQLNPDTMLDELKDGSVHVLNKVASGERILKGKQLVGEGAASAISYPRAGLSFLSFACEMGPTASASVRKAVALSVDSGALCQDYLEGYGLPVYGYYGIGQWMAQESLEQLPSLDLYELNLNAAKNLLAEDGWNLNEDGTPYEEGGVRYRKDGKKLVPLQLRWAYPKGGEGIGALLPMLTANLAEIGVDLAATELPFAELLSHYYRQQERTYNLFSLGTNFSLVFDPYYAYSPDPAFQGVFNTTGLGDEHMMQLVEDMRRTAPSDQAAYLQKWMAFQQYWVQQMPMAPLYSNVYYDFISPKLKNFSTNANWSWATALLYATME